MLNINDLNKFMSPNTICRHPNDRVIPAGSDDPHYVCLDCGKTLTSHPQHPETPKTVQLHVPRETREILEVLAAASKMTLEEYCAAVLEEGMKRLLSNK